jgi:hypothetical protein
VAKDKRELVHLIFQQSKVLTQKYDDKIYYEIMQPNKPSLLTTTVDNGVKITELQKEEQQEEVDDFIGITPNDEL